MSASDYPPPPSKPIPTSVPVTPRAVPPPPVPPPSPAPRNSAVSSEVPGRVLAAMGVFALGSSLVAGVIGGAVGYSVASRPDPVTPIVVMGESGNGVVAETFKGEDAGTAGVSTFVDGSVEKVASRVSPSVAQLEVSSGMGNGTGTGFVIREDGYIVTNHHVAGDPNAQIRVSFPDGTVKDGTLVGSSPDYDLAVIKIDKKNLVPLDWGNSKEVNVGQPVVAFGSPLGLSGTVTSGIVSAVNRPVTTGQSQDDTAYISAVQTDAAINPGNSGGPLTDINGRVIGVNSSIATVGSSMFGEQAGNIGLGFAIPATTAKRVVNDLIKNGKTTTPIIGAQLRVGYGTTPGAVIANVEPNSPAEKAGLKNNDLIVKVEGLPVQDPSEVIVTIRDGAPGDKINLTVKRGEETLEIPVVLDSK